LLPFPFRNGTALLLALALAGSACGQSTAEPAAGPPVPFYTPDQLDQLLGPIALYPDPLLALILPAASTPGDLVAAAAYGAAKADPYDAGTQPWSDSVKALVHYPELVEWLAENLTWVQAVGAAFAGDPNGVMDSVQRLRSRALELGTLVTTPQQVVVAEEGLIEILPADADVIYVPRYDPTVVYLRAAEAEAGSVVEFGAPYHAGFWLTYGFDWRRQALAIGRFSRDGQGWQRPIYVSQGAQVWHPAAPVLRPSLAGAQPLHPNLLTGAPRSRPVFGDRGNGWTPPAGFNPAAVPAGQRPVFPGSAAAGPPGSPAAAEWRLQRAREEREAQARSSPPGGPSPSSSAHASAPPPKPPPPKVSPPANPPPNDQRDKEPH
jgi:hypothetical protein